MARSYRRTPVVGITTADSDKPGKVQANRKLRAVTRHALGRCSDFDNFASPLLREVSDVWGFPKDGKQRMDKDDEYYVREMRK